MKKKILLSFMLICISVFAFGMLNVSAYTGTKYGDYLYYTESNGEIKITDCDESATIIDIPETIDGKKVTSIGYEAFYNCSSLTSVTIPDSVTTIGSEAFYYCYDLTSVTIPDSVTSIGSSAFSNCSSLTSVTIPDGVTSIGNYVFSNCSSLTSVTIPDSVTSIGNYAFRECTGLTSVTIPDSVTSIGSWAFNNCTGLTRVNITDMDAWCSIDFADNSSNPVCYAKKLYMNNKVVTNAVITNKVTAIGSSAFYNCSSLTSVTIPDSVTSIGDYAFSYCSGLTRVNITDMDAWCSIDFADTSSNPLCYAKKLYMNNKVVTNAVITNKVTAIGEYVFYNCSNLTSVTIPDSVTSIGNSAFRKCTGLTSVTIPGSVTSIGNSAFYECTGLTSVTIPDGVKSIGNYAFSDCTGLTSITIPEGVTSIGNSAFSGCSSLTSVTIPDSVTSIGNYAFSGCTGLTSVTIPNSVTSINDYTFSGCNNLEYIVIPNTVTEINQNAFWYSNAVSLVFFTSSEEEWGEMYIASGNDCVKNASKIYNAARRTYKFETNGGAALADVTDYAVMSAPRTANGDKTLAGWYDNKDLSGTPVSFPYHGTATTLYAAWTDKTGLSCDDAFTAKANMQYNVTTTEDGQPVYYEFVPRLTGEYRFYSTGKLDTYGYLYDSNRRQLTYNNNGGDGNNFKITYTLTAGETYYIAAKVYSGTGSFTLVTETDCVESTNTVCATATTGEKIFITTPNYLPENASVILACYKNNALTEVMTAPNKNETLYFITKKDFDSAKVMVWDSLESMTPICDAEIVNTESNR